MPRAYDARLLRRLLRYLRPYKWHVAASLALTAVSAPLVVAEPPLVRAAIDLYLAPDAARAPEGFTLLVQQAAGRFGLGGTPASGIAFVAALVLVANLLAVAVLYAQALILQRVGQFVMYDLRNEIFAHLQRLPVRFYDRNPVGRLMTRMTGDVDALAEMFTSVVVEIVGSAAVLLYIVGWMLLVNTRLALVSFAVLPLLVASTVWFRRRSRAAFRRIRACVADINSFLQERITGMSVVQLFGREAKELRAFRRLTETHRRANLDAVFYNALFYSAVEIIAAAGVGLIVWRGGGQVIQSAATLGTVIAFVQLAQMFYEPVQDISEKYNTLQSAMAASERIFQLLDEPAEPGAPARRARTGRARGRIEFRHVWFAYEGEDWVLKDVSFRVEPGQSVAFVGHTGAGKTTVMNLLLRFYDPARGQILLDGVDVRELDPSELRAQFSVVPQDGFLFSGDVASNIRLGESSISDEQMRAAARHANADRFVGRLDNGYSTELGERGARLSSGQKQLISFARALAFDPRVLVLDEATSSVDTETELLLQDALARLLRGRTSLVIAHRLSTIQSVDKIIVMHKGEVRETGTHGELLARRGLYWRLHQLGLCRDDEEALAESLTGD